ncbi:MAG: glycoside hydrolase family 127 protein [Tyzzerella sp.]|nr:glycoside hydrolase family 127 protein [Tyzzerella sp.]
MKMKQLYTQSLKMVGIMDKAVDFVIANQLKDKKTWRTYIDVFTTRDDSEELWWRGEFFGKQMRGACYAYLYSQDEELYDILTWACSELLKTQDEYGRFSTYTIEKEFNGWDMWGRKYVLTGLQHYYQICRDEHLKETILKAEKKHMDYIISKIGPGKIDITTTSSWWGCVNSCTILEPTMELYKMTKEPRYLEFAKYIISKGGSADCNLVELPIQEGLYPYQYPVTKAYEMMSFYEGLIAYYEATGEKEYLEVADRFIEAVQESDITIIGCAGCTEELFDHAAVMQTKHSDVVMQETCVTVTWMRVLVRMYFLTGDAKYIDRIEKSGYNALYGSLNTKQCKHYDRWSKEYLPAKCFDSYSPLYMNTRGRWIGGISHFENGDYTGCCVAIGACGISLMPLTAVVTMGEYTHINHQFTGEACIKDASGKDVQLTFASRYPQDGVCKIKIQCQGECNLKLKIRKPDWCETMLLNGTEVVAEGYQEVTGIFKDGDEITFEWKLALKVHRLNEKVAFTYGAITLALDSAKSDRDIRKPVVVGDKPIYRIILPEEDELIRMECETEDGTILLTDYQSCGKEWTGEKNMISVWLNTK